MNSLLLLFTLITLPSCFRASISFLYYLGNHRAPLDFKIGYTKMRITILYATTHLTKSQSDGISKLPQISFILRREHGKMVGPLPLDTQPSSKSKGKPTVKSRACITYRSTPLQVRGPKLDSMSKVPCLMCSIRYQVVPGLKFRRNEPRLALTKSVT